VHPDFLPPSLSLAQWQYVFTYSSIGRAVATSFTIAPLATLLAFVLSLPTAYALGRYRFPGKETLNVLILLPIVMPGMVIALFLSRAFDMLGLSGVCSGWCSAMRCWGCRSCCASWRRPSRPFRRTHDAARNRAGWRRWSARAGADGPAGLFAGAIFTFIASLEEFNLTFVIGTPTFETIPTVLFGYLGYHFVRTNAAVVSIILMVPSIVLLFIAERYLKTEYLSSAFGKL
jgi:putative spermidine/putrescine transport system permease protein